MSAWKSVAPSDHMSLAGVARPPVAISGARYAGEPVTCPVWVVWESTPRAIPKSVSLARSARPTTMLAGFTSRWTMPAAWAERRAEAI